MRAHTILLMASLLSMPLFGQNLKQQADNMQVAQPTAADRTLKVPSIPGAKVKILGADYEGVINRKGEISPVVSDVAVRVCFSVEKGGEKAVSKDYYVTVPAAAKPAGNAKPTVIPDLLEWKGGNGVYSLGDTIAGDPVVAKELAADAKALLGRDLKVLSAGDPAAEKASVRLVIKSKKPRGASDEYYELAIGKDRVTISAYAPKGLYWGTRSLLQILKQGKGTAPCGLAKDMPRFGLRGFMLDVARLPMPLADLKGVIRTMAWYKMNDLHLHLNDNFIFLEDYVDRGEDPAKAAYNAFRLESSVKGKDGTPLTAQDLSYSRKEFADLLAYAKRHGVNIVPEFDTPGHALAFTRVRPDLTYQGPMNENEKRRAEMLDASRPETVDFVGKVWDEYLQPLKKGEKALFAPCPVVHVGADEFFGDKEDYRRYADGLLKHILKRGYTPRIWGSLHKKTGKTPVVAKGVQVNVWGKGWAKAWESINQGYDIINTTDQKLYFVPYATYYRMDQNHQSLYETWEPNNVHEQWVPAGHPQLLGATFAVWQDCCDLRHNGYMLYDIWPEVTGSMDVLSQKMWGLATAPRSFAEHRQLVKEIGAAPQTDLARRGSLAEKPVDITPGKLPQQLKLGSLGPEYHLTVELTLDAAPEGAEQVLLDSPEGQLLAVDKDGCVGFRRADTMEFSFAGAKLPIGKRVKLEIIGKPGSTQLLLDGQPAGTLTLRTYHKRTDGLVATLILPMDRLGASLKGTVHSLKLSPTAE